MTEMSSYQSGDSRSWLDRLFEHWVAVDIREGREDALFCASSVGGQSAMQLSLQG